MKKERERRRRRRTEEEIEEKPDISSISCDVCAEMLWQLLASGKRPPKIHSILATRRTNYTNLSPTQRRVEEKKKKENKKERNLQSAKKPKQNSRSRAAAK